MESFGRIVLLMFRWIEMKIPSFRMSLSGIQNVRSTFMHWISKQVEVSLSNCCAVMKNDAGVSVKSRINPSACYVGGGGSLIVVTAFTISSGCASQLEYSGKKHSKISYKQDDNQVKIVCLLSSLLKISMRHVV